MPEPYQSVIDLPFDDHGWFGNADPLQRLIKHTQAKTVIEVGCWLGLSTRYIASTLPHGGIVYAVDHWCGSPAEAVHMQDPRLPYLYQLFLSNVKHAHLTEAIVPIRMSSLEASRALCVKADLIYLDASHDIENVYLDIYAWLPHLAENGILCGDDWNWPSVRVSVELCASRLHKKVHAERNFWWYE